MQEVTWGMGEMQVFVFICIYVFRPTPLADERSFATGIPGVTYIAFHA